MSLANITKSALICIIVAATMLINPEDNLLARHGFAGSYLFLLLAVLLVTIFAMGANTFIAAIVIIFTMNANMPGDFALNFGMDRDIFAISMVVLLITSFSWTLIEHQKNGFEEKQLANELAS